MLAEAEALVDADSEALVLAEALVDADSDVSMLSIFKLSIE
ncbi:hypothetical protein [Streptococcus sp. oral taxon 431]